MAQNFIDPETAAKVNILSIAETAAAGPRFAEAGIPLDSLPPWVARGTSRSNRSLREVVDQCLEEGMAKHAAANSAATSMGGSPATAVSPLDAYFYPPLPGPLLEAMRGHVPGSGAAEEEEEKAVESEEDGHPPLHIATVVASGKGGSWAKRASACLWVAAVASLAFFLLLGAVNLGGLAIPSCSCSCISDGSDHLGPKMAGLAFALPSAVLDAMSYFFHVITGLPAKPAP